MDKAMTCCPQIKVRFIAGKFDLAPYCLEKDFFVLFQIWMLENKLKKL